MNVGFSWVGFSSGTSPQISSSWLFFLGFTPLAGSEGGGRKTRPACSAVAVRPVGCMKPKSQRKCLLCRCVYTPDHRNRKRQKYCTKPDCRKAAKAASQRNWLSKPENQNYFRGPESTRRVQQWRLDHPEHRKRRRRQAEAALQDSLVSETFEQQQVTPPRRQSALQESCAPQDALFVGFMSVLTGYLSQEDIDNCIRSFVIRGTDILACRK